MQQDDAHVLVVDDEPDICWLLQLMLQPLGMRVTACGSGEEALARLAETHYMVAFIDAILPDTNGVTLLARISQQSPQTVVVLMSGFYYQEDPAIGEALSQQLVIGFIAKPFHNADVRLLAQQALALSKKVARCRMYS